jgi:hypothetical protein
MLSKAHGRNIGLRTGRRTTRTWQQRGGYNGYRIPADRFRGSFGPDRRFRFGGLPFMVASGYPRFQNGGYWLTILDPWPANWEMTGTKATRSMSYIPTTAAITYITRDTRA